MSLKNVKLQARVTEKDYDKIMKMAIEGGYKNLSEYLRNKVVNKKIIEYDFGDINERLAKLGGELNHLVMLCHQGVIETADMTRFDKEINILREKLSNAKFINVKRLPINANKN